MNNQHGKWETRSSSDFKNRIDQLMGQPWPQFPQCSYCGSITPVEFLLFCQQGRSMELADMKYGWPHKVYIEIPNPNPDEQRIVSTKSGPEVDGKHPNDIRDGKRWTRVTYGTFPTLRLKFYTTHLKDFELLPNGADLIESRIGIHFEIRDGKLHWSKQPNN